MGTRSRKNSLNFEVFRKQRRPRTCADRWRHHALANIRQRRQAEKRRRLLWLIVLVAGFLSGTRSPAITPRRSINNEYRNPAPNETVNQRCPERPPWTKGFRRAPICDRDLQKVARRLAGVVRENRDYRTRPADHPLQSDRKVRPGVL